MKRYSTIALGVAVFAVSACKDNPVANPIEAPTIDALGSLTRTSLQQLTIGAMAQSRVETNNTPHAIQSGIFARDVYRIESSEPRWVSETLGGQPDPGSFAGGRGFTGFYTAIRAYNTILLALGSANPALFTTAEINAMRGFLRTQKAVDYMSLIALRDTVGIPIQSDDPAEVTAVRCKAAVLSYVAALLDSANADFAAAGAATALPIPATSFPTGFRSFGRNYTIVSNLILYNRGWKGKVDYYRGIDRSSPTPSLFPTAITELTQALGGAAPGAVPPANFANGAYWVFVPGGSEAQPNAIAENTIGLNPMVGDSIQAGDTRASKIVTRTAPLTGQGLSTNITYVGAVASPANQARPLPILRDEELVLLRAQAYIETDQLANALLDINSVRTSYGLPPHVAFADKQTAITALLYEKRYSLLFEGPQRLMDLREYRRLNSTYLRQELPTDPYNAALPLPRGELDARGVSTNPACTP
jgi:hypothetical protein